jgi:SAM-dependent methyltransferase
VRAQTNSDQGTSIARWDAMAEDFERQFSRSDYRRIMVDRIVVSQNETVLDVGCGPGTLALPLAHKAKWVTALDISPAMLRVAAARAKDEGLANIHFLHADWNAMAMGDDLQPHDVVVCSRALSVQDPQKALTKLDQAATRHVYVTVRNGPDNSEHFYLELHRELGLEAPQQNTRAAQYVALLQQLGIDAEEYPITYTDSFRYSKATDAWRILKTHVPVQTASEEAALMAFVRRNMAINGSFKLDIESSWMLLSWRATAYRQRLKHHPR